MSKNANNAVNVDEIIDNGNLVAGIGEAIQSGKTLVRLPVVLTSEQINTVKADLAEKYPDHGFAISFADNEKTGAFSPAKVQEAKHAKGYAEFEKRKAKQDRQKANRKRSNKPKEKPTLDDVNTDATPRKETVFTITYP